MKDFEPDSVVYQHSPQRYNDIMSNFDKTFKKNLTKNFKGMKYFEPFSYCPQNIFQHYNDDYGSPYKDDPGGFCAMWSHWWANLRLANPDVDRQKLMNQVKKQLMFGGKHNFKRFIRNYSNFIINEKKNLYKSKIIPKDIQKTLMSKGDVSYNSHFAKFVSSCRILYEFIINHYRLKKNLKILIYLNIM